MNEKEFFDFVYDEYKAELALAFSLQQRIGVLITAAVIIGGASVSISRIELLTHIFASLEIVLIQITTFLVVLFLVAGIICLFLAAIPRDYPKLGKTYFWSRWRKDYWKILVEDDSEDEERNRRALNESTLDAILKSIAEAQTTAAYLNQKRLRAFHWATCCMTLAVGSLMLQGILVFILKVQGV